MPARVTPAAEVSKSALLKALSTMTSTSVADMIDPMKSRETAGWLRGELRAPT